jgi:hypothetical protein
MKYSLARADARAIYWFGLKRQTVLNLTAKQVEEAVTARIFANFDSEKINN